MFYPSNRFLLLCLAPLALALIAPLLQFVADVPSLLQISQNFVLIALLSLDALLALLFILDGLTIPRRKRFVVERTTDRVFSANFPHQVTLDIVLLRGWIRNRLRAFIYDDAQEGMDVTEFPHDSELRAGRNRIEGCSGESGNQVAGGFRGAGGDPQLLPGRATPLRHAAGLQPADTLAGRGARPLCEIRIYAFR